MSPNILLASAEIESNVSLARAYLYRCYAEEKAAPVGPAYAKARELTKEAERKLSWAKLGKPFATH
jgi:hypothetical protein